METEEEAGFFCLYNLPATELDTISKDNVAVWHDQNSQELTLDDGINFNRRVL